MNPITNNKSAIPIFSQTNLKFLIIIPFVIIILLMVEMRDFAVDDAYITFRHAKNLIEGKGFVFNPGDRLLSTTAPLHGLILALLAWSNLGPLPQLAIALSTISLILLCFSTTWTLSECGFLTAGLFAAMFLASLHWMYSYSPLETDLLLALNMTTIMLAVFRKWGAAGLIAGLATVTRADAVLVSITVGVYILITQQSRWRDLITYGIGFIIITFFWFGFAFFYYGNLFPNTLAAKSGFNQYSTFVAALPRILSSLFFIWKPLSTITVGLAFIGSIIVIKRKSPLIMLLVWGSLHTLGYTLLRISFPHAWYYAPINFIVCVMASIGLISLFELTRQQINKINPSSQKYLTGTVQIIMIVTILGFIAMSLATTLQFTSAYRTDYYGGARDQVYRDVATWLKQNSEPDSTVALLEVGTIGFYSDRHIIDLLGLVTYELRNLPKQGSPIEGVELLQPTYVVNLRDLPPSPDLTGIDGYIEVQRYPRNDTTNLFTDIVIYQLATEASQ